MAAGAKQRALLVDDVADEHAVPEAGRLEKDGDDVSAADAKSFQISGKGRGSVRRGTSPSKALIHGSSVVVTSAQGGFESLEATGEPRDGSSPFD